MQTPELQRFLSASHQLVCSTAQTAVHTALLPVTLPMRLACQTTDMVVGTVAATVFCISVVPLCWLRRCKTKRNGMNPVIALIQNVFGIPGFCLGVAFSITDQVGSIVVHSVSPALGRNASASANNKKYKDSGNKKASSDPHEKIEAKEASVLKATSFKKGKDVDDDDWLERLRLDYVPRGAACHSDNHCRSNRGSFKTVEPVRLSEFLLRLDDLEVFYAFQQQQVSEEVEKKKLPMKVHYIDLSDSASVDYIPLRDVALEKMFQCAMSMLADHPTVRLAKTYTAAPESLVAWKPEGSTGKLLKQMAKRSTAERLTMLQHDVLIWSVVC